MNISDLNPAQNKASQTHDGPLLVIAGAGTGKTRTLIYRLVKLIQKGIPAESILLLTFTRRASQEMIVRASELLDGEFRKICGGTFHSFGNLMLRRYGRLNGIANDFTVLDQADSLEIISRIRSELNLSERGRRFPRRETIAAIISKTVNQQVSIERILEKDYSHLSEEASTLEKISSSYKAYKSDRQLMDFDDLLIQLIELLQKSEEAKSRICAAYPYVMVDEYQDTNLLQAMIAQELSGAKKNIMVVGDEAQSIYAFRGASFRNLFDFQQTFHNTQLIKLEENYRSTQPILDLSNGLLNHMTRSFRKQLFTNRPGDGKPVLAETPGEKTQASFVVDEICKLSENGVNLSEIAVLFRASHQAYQLELELGHRNISYTKYGGFRFMELAHIKDILSHLSVYKKPSDDLNLRRILLLCTGVGNASARKIEKLAKSKPLSEAIEEYLEKNKGKDSLKKLAKLMKNLSRESEKPSDLLEKVIDYYDPILEVKFYDDWPKRKRGIDQLLVISNNYRDLQSFLTDMAIDPPNRERSSAKEENKMEGDLSLSTIHSAKGLEWKVVFILNTVNGSFPRQFEDQVEDNYSQEKYDEDRRLLYVAVTRAKDELFLVWPSSVSGKFGFRWNTVSPFLVELPQSIFEKRFISREHKSW